MVFLKEFLEKVDFEKTKQNKKKKKKKTADDKKKHAKLPRIQSVNSWICSNDDTIDRN